MKNRSELDLGGAVAAVALSLAAMPAWAADENPFQAREVTQPSPHGQKVAHGMCGGNWEGRCGGMMGGMMMGGVMPPATDPAQLPEPTAAGAKLLTRYCTQCHGLPNPNQHSAEGWPMTVARMQTRMQWMARNSPMGINAPSEAELKTLLSYLQTHAADSEPTAPAAAQGNR